MINDIGNTRVSKYLNCIFVKSFCSVKWNSNKNIRIVVLSNIKS
nr:MAG TPA: hypothetical protein [Caudoviricetes sp.]